MRSVIDRYWISYNEQKILWNIWKSHFKTRAWKFLVIVNLKFKLTLWILPLFMFSLNNQLSTHQLIPVLGHLCSETIYSPGFLTHTAVPSALQQIGKAARNQHLVKYLGASSVIMWVFLFLMLSLLCLETVFQIFPGASASPLSHPVA